MAIEIGDEAPDFELPDQDRQPVRLSSYRGKKNVVLVFYPLSFTGTCQAELCTIRDQIEDFTGGDVVTLAVSVDSTAVHKRWADEQGYTFPILADFWPHGQVSRQYGVFDEAGGFALRGTFIIDKAGRIAYTVVNPMSTARDAEDYRKVLASL